MISFENSVYLFFILFLLPVWFIFYINLKKIKKAYSGLENTKKIIKKAENKPIRIRSISILKIAKTWDVFVIAFIKKCIKIEYFIEYLYATQEKMMPVKNAGTIISML